MLVYSCVRCYFKEFRKVRSPAQTASNLASATDRAGVYMWAMTQAHRITTDFVENNWKEYPAIAEVIKYHLFRFMVSLSLYNKVKDKVKFFRKQDK